MAHSNIANRTARVATSRSATVAAPVVPHRIEQLHHTKPIDDDACVAREPSLIQTANHRLRHLIERVSCSATAVRANADRHLGQLPDVDEPGDRNSDNEFDGEANELDHLISVLESRQSEVEYQVRRYERL